MLRPDLIFAAEDIHISLQPEAVLRVGGFDITNSMLYGVIVAIVSALIMIAAAKRIKIKPTKGLHSIIEIIVEYTTNILAGPFGTKERAARFAPIFGFFFIFILFNNLAGILPIVSPGIYSAIEGSNVPLFRPFTADLNGTIAMSVIAILIVQYLSIKEQGGKKHFQHYFSDKPWNPINLFIGILEVFGEFTRVLSLSLRLFLNTAVGEILIVVFASVILANARTPLTVIPILLFEALVAYIQAYVFMVLCGTYLGMAIAHADAHHEEEHLASLSEGVDSRGMQGG